MRTVRRTAGSRGACLYFTKLLAVWLLRIGEPLELGGFPRRRLRVHDPRRSQCGNEHLILAAGQAVTARGGSGITPAGELRNHLGIRPRKRLDPTGILAKPAPVA